MKPEEAESILFQLMEYQDKIQIALDIIGKHDSNMII